MTFGQFEYSSKTIATLYRPELEIGLSLSINNDLETLLSEATYHLTP